MEKWQVIRLFETDEASGKKSQIGGGITRMRIGGVNGPLHAIEVEPVSVKDMKAEAWEDSFVRFQVADRVVWMDDQEVQTLINLLQLAYDASRRNYGKSGL